MHLKPVEKCKNASPACIIILFAFLFFFLTGLDIFEADAKCNKAEFTVALDIGHSKKRCGAVSARGVGEFTYNKAMAEVILKELNENGFVTSFIINENGKGLRNSKRPLLAKEKKADLYISIHHDSVQPHYLSSWMYKGKRRRYCDLFTGYSLFVSMENKGHEKNLHFARVLGTELRVRGLKPTLHHAEKIKGENRELIDEWRGIYRFDELTVLKYATMPAILMECGIILNREEELRLQDPAYRKKIAEAISRAVLEMCRLWSKK